MGTRLEGTRSARPALLVGIDFEGDTRETWVSSVAEAVKHGIRACAPSDDPKYPPWRSFSVWANEGKNDQWICVKNERPRTIQEKGKNHAL